MSHALKDCTNLPQKQKGPRASETHYRKPMFKAYRLLESNVTTRAVSLSSARDLEEHLEHSSKNLTSKKDLFVPGTPSPHICYTAQSSQASILDSSVKKNLSFEQTGLEESFSLLMTPVFGKRSREDTLMSVGKKCKEDTKTIDTMQIELLDPDLMVSEYFRCYKEADIVSDLDIRENVIQNECDDDCPTDDAQIEVCISYLASQIEQSILSEI
ncbi:unnamed protein product [Blepharisma stoltei]|uniref:Uncharacterized protein n=1 Tax=Blepharisma stoltei TaxID=1481888 RepID=A0AAU9J455_9CILI|nr:unnamed protein product [Blepharisma stoltei]